MTRGRSTIVLKLPYLTDRHIEDEAALLLAEFGNKHGQVTAPPIPIDDIIELYLELTFEFKDMQALFGVGDVHGALWVNERRVGVDASLDPEQHPVKLGRYRFTLANEAGHWRLHRHLFQKRANQFSLLPEDAQRAEYVCRSTDRGRAPAADSPGTHGAGANDGFAGIETVGNRHARRSLGPDRSPAFRSGTRSHAGSGGACGHSASVSQ